VGASTVENALGEIVNNSDSSNPMLDDAIDGGSGGAIESIVSHSAEATAEAMSSDPNVRKGAGVVGTILHKLVSNLVEQNETKEPAQTIHQTDTTATTTNTMSSVQDSD